MWWVEIYFFCKTFNCLPSAGGVLDQKKSDMRRLYKVASAESEANKAEQAKSEAENKLKKRMGQ